MRTMIFLAASLALAGNAYSQEVDPPTPKDLAYLIMQAPPERFETRQIDSNSFRASYEEEGVKYEVCYNCSDDDGNLGRYEAAGLYLTKTSLGEGAPRTEVFRAWTPFSFTPSADFCVRDDRVVWRLGDVQEEPGAKNWCINGFETTYDRLVDRARP